MDASLAWFDWTKHVNWFTLRLSPMTIHAWHLPYDLTLPSYSTYRPYWQAHKRRKGTEQKGGMSQTLHPKKLKSKSYLAEATIKMPPMKGPSVRPGPTLLSACLCTILNLSGGINTSPFHESISHQNKMPGISPW